MTTHDHQIEHAATGSTVEQADARGHAGDAALRFAPPWVVERIAKIREERGLAREVENRAVVETAAEDRATAAVTRSLAFAPPHIRARVNEVRRRRGLTEIAAPRPEPTGPGVWSRDRKTGRIVPVTSSTSRSPARPATPRATPRPVARTIERVVIVPAPSFSDADPRNIGSMFAETIAPDAFGTAADLNCDSSWDLRLGHHGPRLALPGPALRVHDTAHGIALEWEFDPTAPMAPEARQALRRGAVSVAMTDMTTRTIRLPALVNLVTRARLRHVALLVENERPCYPAATAIIFPGSRAGDARQFREQLDAVIREARFRNSRSKS